MPENKIPDIKLNNGVKMPALGFGTAMISQEEMQVVINGALDAGYRYFDCAPAYGNQAGVCKALLSSGARREELFISTKLPGAERGYEKTLSAFEAVCKEMGLDYLDFYAIHLPQLDFDANAQSWKAMEKLHNEGRIRSIGLSSFMEVHIDHILDICEIPPQADLLECNPFFTNTPVRDYCASKGIHVISWFVLGGPPVLRRPIDVKEHPRLLENERLISIARDHGKTPSQIALRWSIQRGTTALIKASRPEHMRENLGVFDFDLSDVEMGRIEALNYDRRFGLDPMASTSLHP